MNNHDAIKAAEHVHTEMVGRLFVGSRVAGGGRDAPT